jgi:hypothetical protein
MVPDDEIDHQKSDQTEKEDSDGEKIEKDSVDDFSG